MHDGAKQGSTVKGRIPRTKFSLELEVEQLECRSRESVQGERVPCSGAREQKAKN